MVSKIAGLFLVTEFGSFRQANPAMSLTREAGSASGPDGLTTADAPDSQTSGAPDNRNVIVEGGGRGGDHRRVLTRYDGQVYRVVFGPPSFVEQRNGALLGSGMPSIGLADPETGVQRHGLTIEIPEAPLRPGQVLVGGGEDGLRALSDAGVVRFTGTEFHSKRFLATFAVCDLLVGPFRRRPSVSRN